MNKYMNIGHVFSIKLYICKFICGPDQCGSVGGVSSCRERSLVQFLVREHAWVTGLFPSQGTCEKQLIDISLSC